MSDSSSRDYRVRNVRLWRRKKAVLGTLTLTKHHLVYSYVLDDSGGESRTAPPGFGEAGQRLSASNENSSSGGKHARTESASNETAGKESGRHRHPTKTMFIAYPMINRCLLRPSHLQGAPSRLSMAGDDTLARESHEEFPPTFGSANPARPSTDSAHLAPYSSPQRAPSPSLADPEDKPPDDTGRSPAIRIRSRDFHMMAFHFYSSSHGQTADELAREVFFALRSRCCVDHLEQLYAFHFHPPPQEKEVAAGVYDPRREFARMGIGGKAAEGPGSAWRISDINRDYAFSATYPSVLCVPKAVSDNMLKYGGVFRSRARIPALAYLHFNGGSITRSSQPLVGVQGKRNPQDERLVSAIFSSHGPSVMPPEESASAVRGQSATSVAPDTDGTSSKETQNGLHQSQSETAIDEKGMEAVAAPSARTYGSTRKNLIVDARPKLNALANRATGGGIEDIANYTGVGEVPIEKRYLDIQNIHVMRASLEKVIDSFANSDYLDLKPDQELLRKSGWLGHVGNLVEGADVVARSVGLSGSHVLVHCSDGWDRTAQVSALAQIMLDPHYRTLDGFISLVQKDFVSFGHKFRDRNGIKGCEKWFEIENERIAPSKQRENSNADANSLNALGSKALSGARSWFEKNRGSLFRQQNASHESLSNSSSRPASPPPNPVIHSPPTKENGEDKEHKTDEKEIAPIFHQFLEAVWQIQRKWPAAFEFNERFLLRLLYQTYACQYGEFLFNNEKERMECEKKRLQHGQRPLPSVWMHFLARRAEFTNTDYARDKYDAVLLPRNSDKESVEVRWWSRLFGRTDEEMNVPRALAPADPPVMRSEASSVSFDEGVLPGAEIQDPDVAGGLMAVRHAKSTPNFNGDEKKDSALTSSVSDMNLQGPGADNEEIAAIKVPQRPSITQQETDLNVLAKYAGSSGTAATPAESAQAQAEEVFDAAENDSDPLGVAQGITKKQAQQKGGIDFAAFASQNAYSDR